MQLGDDDDNDIDDGGELRGQRNHHHDHNTLNYRLEDYRNVEELVQLNVNKIISIGNV